jgi:spore coat polysaccharide biosynthesis predicted glycosyltransferase SpsG
VPALAASRHACQSPDAPWPRAAALVVDHYGVAATDLGPETPPVVMWIDDVPGRDLPGALVLNQNAGINAAAYDGRTGAGTTLLLGPRHALLRPDFAAGAARPADPPRVFVSFGLTDYGGQALTALRAVQAAGLACDLAVGSSAPTLPALHSAAGPGTVIHVDSPRVADLMARATLAIGAAGSMSWERCALGLPAIAVPVVDNQAGIAAALAEAGAATVMAPPLDPTRLRAALTSLMEDTPRRTAMGRAARALCDGQGAARVAEALRARIAQTGD